MRKLAVVLACLLLVPVVALADGGIFPDYVQHLYEPKQLAVMTWDGSVQTMVLATKFSADSLGNMAWVVPIRSSVKPEVVAGDSAVFREFVDYFIPPASKGVGFGLGGLPRGLDESVVVLEVKKVDIYDVAILKSDSATALASWLNSNGYYAPPSAAPVFAKYAGDDWYFVANKVNLKNKYAATIAEVEKFNSSFEKLSLDDQLSVFSDLFYGGNLSDEVAANNFENTLYNLQSGVATPLKFTFSPPKPFYPLVISSLNSGETDIEVYLASQTAMKDQNGALAVDEALTITDSLRNSVKNYINLGDSKIVTRLAYRGNLSGLNSDSEFVPCPECSVGNVEVQQATAAIIPLVVIAPILAGAVSLIFSPAFALSLLAMYVRAKKFKKKLGWKKAVVIGYVAGALASMLLFLDVFVGTPMVWVLAFHAVVTLCLTAFLGRKWKSSYRAFIVAYVCASLVAAIAVIALAGFLFPAVF
jgi:hypothetical protein